jgi:hypothetical protein
MAFWYSALCAKAAEMANTKATIIIHLFMVVFDFYKKMYG